MYPSTDAIFIYLLIFLVFVFFVYLVLSRIRKKTKWKPTTNKLILYSFVIAILFKTYPWFYVVDDIEGWIVDENGKPVQGVLVTARWDLIHSIAFISIDTIAHFQSGILEAKETVTDKNGRYYFPGFWKLSPLLQRLEIQSPDIRAFKVGLFFHPGQIWHFRNNRDDWLDFGIFRGSVWDGSKTEIIRMETDSQRSRAGEGISAFVETVLRYSDCMWTKIPKAIAFDSNRERRRGVQIYGDNVSISRYKKNMSQCGVDEGFFKGLNPWKIKKP